MMAGSIYYFMAIIEVHGWALGAFIIVGGTLAYLWFVHCMAQLFPHQQTTPDIIGMLGIDTQ
jgi:hypothetical protein